MRICVHLVIYHLLQCKRSTNALSSKLRLQWCYEQRWNSAAHGKYLNVHFLYYSNIDFSIFAVMSLFHVIVPYHFQMQ